jgi:lipopolysaccharide export system protein LptA
MKNTINAILSGLMLSVCLISSAVAEPAQLKFAFKMLEAPEAWITKNKLDHPPHEISEQVFKAISGKNDIAMLSAPQIVALENQEARIEIKEEPLEYLEKTDTGFEPRKMAEKDAPGVSLTVKGRRVEDGEPGEIRIDWTASIVTLTGRQPLPGVKLDVGMPVISAQEVTSVIELFDGKWWLLAKLAALEKNGKKPVLIFAQVSEITPAVEPAHPEVPVELQADKTAFDSKTGAIRASGNVRIAAGNVTILADAVTLDKKAKKSVGIQADKVVFQDNPAGRMRLEGNVRLHTQAGLITADSLVIDRASVAVAAEPEAESPMEKKLKSIIVPRLEFQDAHIEDALEFFRAVSREADPKRHGVNIVYKPRAGQDNPSVSMSLTQVPLFDAIRFLTEVGGVDFRITDSAVIIE